MTDYLEELEEQESALARERERLEAALAGLRSAETETAEERAVLNETGGSAAGAREAGETYGSLSRQEETAAPAADTAGEAQEEATGRGKKEEERFPLLEQVMALEETLQGLQGVAAPSGGRGSLVGAGRAALAERPDGGGWDIRRSGTGEAVPFSFQGHGTAAGETLGGWPLEAGALREGAPGQARRLDRLLRRDERRYDSGFFLY